MCWLKHSDEIQNPLPEISTMSRTDKLPVVVILFWGTFFWGTLISGKSSLVAWQNESEPVAPVEAQDEPVAPAAEQPSEIWVGILDVEVAKLRLQLNLNVDAAGKTTGELLSLDQTSTPLPITAVIRSQDKLAFSVPQLGVSYEGSIDGKEGEEIASGVFAQQGRKIELAFRRSKEAVSITHQSTWTGQFSAGPQPYDFQFRVFKDNFEMSSVKLDSFTEGVWGIPIEYEKKENQIIFRNRLTQGEFLGIVSADGSTIEGNWIQRGQTIPMTLKQVPVEQTREAKFNRPQTPVPPFPYQQKNFAIVVKEIDPKYEHNVGIAGTVTMPEATADAKSGFPTVILISGNGPQDRDFTTLGHKPFAILADHLTRLGFAVIRFDDRGAGQSVGNVSNATTLNHANDAEAVYRWAQQQKEFDPKRIVLLGHSEGAIIAGMIAMRQPDVAGIVLLSGTATNGRDVFLRQSAAIAKVSKVPDEIIEKQLEFFNEVFAEAGKAPLELAKIKEMFQTRLGELTDQQKIDYGIGTLPEAVFSLLKSPWMNFYFDYDPRTALAYIKCPVLSLFGEKDLQSIPEVEMPAIKGAIEVAQNLDFEQEVLTGLNNMFQPCQTGSPREYYAIETSFDESALELISKWLQRRFVKQ